MPDREGRPTSRLIVPLMGALLLVLAFTFPFGRTMLDPEAVDREEIPLFDVVIPGKLYRSGQPTPEGVDWLCERGMRTFINLREEEEDLEWIRQYRSKRYFHIALRDHYPPTTRQMNEILQIVKDSNSWPILIHCKAGKGRTGAIVAAIRTTLNDWTVDRAFAEAKVARKDGYELNRRHRAFVRQWTRVNRQADRQRYHATWPIAAPHAK